MTIVLLATGLAVLAIPAVGWRRLSSHLAPAHLARFVALALALGGVIAETGLVLHALPTLALLTGRTGGGADAPLIAHVSPGGIGAGAASALVASLVAWRGGGALLRRHRSHRLARADAWLGEHTATADHDVVIIPTDASVAYAIAGDPPQIILSEGLVRRLQGAQLDVVIRHERAHLQHRHDRFLVLATVVERAFGWLPYTASSCSALRAAVERWADESAVTAADERWTMERALMAMVHSVPSPAVDERRRAMRQPPIVSSPTILALGAAVLALVAAPGLVALGHWFSDASGLVAALTAP